MTATEDADRLEWLGDRTMRLLAAAMDRKSDQSANLLAEVADRMGTPGMYALCCGLAETVRQFAFPGVKQGDGSLTGDIVAVQSLPGRTDEEPHMLWACRFVAAYINGDADTSTALFFGSIRDEDAHTGGVVSLLAMAADIARAKEAEATT